jgi:hypothetical protein
MNYIHRADICTIGRPNRIRKKLKFQLNWMSLSRDMDLQMMKRKAGYFRALGLKAPFFRLNSDYDSCQFMFIYSMYGTQMKARVEKPQNPKFQLIWTNL